MNQFAETIWHNFTKKYYTDRGYTFTSVGDSFLVDVRDLPHGSGVVVEAYCAIHDKFRSCKYSWLVRAGHSTCKKGARLKDITNQRFNRLVAIRRLEVDSKKGSIWECVCDCSNVVGVQLTSLLRGKTGSCGCYKPRTTGKNHHNWNPDLTKEDRRRNRSQFSKFSKPVFKRDNYTCQVTGDSSGSDLNAHHLNSHKHFEKARFDIDNGVTLKRKVHQEFHSWMGGTAIRCTRNDFVEFCNIFYPDALFLKNISGVGE